MVRISEISRWGLTRSRKPLDREDGIDRVTPRGTKYSDCNSLPLLGVNPMRKWGKPVVPGAGHPHLLRAVLRREFGDRVQVPGRAASRHRTRSGAANAGSASTRRLTHTSLIRSLLPVGEQAHAVAARHDRVEVVRQLRQRQVLVDILTHRKVGRMSSVTFVTTPRAPRGGRPHPRNVSPSFSRESVRTSPSARDEFQGRDRRRQVPVP